MPFKIIGKVLFPHLQPWERTRRAKHVVGVSLTAVALAGMVAMLLFKQNASHH